MKLLFKYFLFLSLISLVSCTITKRKYTGGYYIGGLHKAPDATTGAEEKEAHTEPGKTNHPDSSSVKSVPEQKKDNSIAPPVEKEVKKDNSVNPSGKTNVETQESKGQENAAPKMDPYKRHVAFSWIFFFLGLASAALVFLNIPLSLTLLLVFLAMLLFAFSVFHGLRAMKRKFDIVLSFVISIGFLGILALGLLLLLIL